MGFNVGVVIDPWDFPYNGTVVSTRRFVAALDEEIDFKLLATPKQGDARDDRIVAFPKLSIPGFNRVIEGMKVPLANPWGATHVEDSLRGLDLVHMQFPFFLGAAVCRAAKRLELPLICSFHVQPENLLRNIGLNSSWLAKLLYKLFISVMYRHADLVLPPSKFAADQLRLHGLKQPIEVLSNGVPGNFFELQRRPSETGTVKILSVGPLASEKHHQSIFSALARSRHSSKIELRVIGAGPLELQLKRHAKNLGINATIGTASDRELCEAYQSADLFVHAGEIELEGMSVLEAMAAGNAVLISDSKDSAAVEFIQDERALFSRPDLNDLVTKLDYWLDHPVEREAAGIHNRKIALQRHHDKSVQQLRDTYHRFLSPRCGAKAV